MAIILKPENVAQLVLFIRGEKVLLDADLAMLYGVEARSLNQAVARNRKRSRPISCFNSPRKSMKASGHSL
jgi:ORF6N domain-containing protein